MARKVFDNSWLFLRDFPLEMFSKLSRMGEKKHLPLLFPPPPPTPVKNFFLRSLINPQNISSVRPQRKNCRSSEFSLREHREILSGLEIIQNPKK